MRLWKPLALTCDPTRDKVVDEPKHPEMEDALRAVQQQVSALTNQNAALEAQLRGQQNIAQGLAELPGVESCTSTDEKDVC